MDTIGIPTFIVVRPNSKSLSVSQGKGVDLDSARVSGIMESIEQFHAEAVRLPFRFSAVAELRRQGRVVNVDALPTYFETLTPSSRIPWVEGADVLSMEPIWVPYELVSLDLTIPFPPGSGYFLPTSNGLASGNTIPEAIAHGICEVVERDAVALFYRLSPEAQWRRRIDPDSVEEPTSRALLQAYAAANVDVAVWDVTSNIGVPCYLCSILDADPDPFRPVGLARGSGCHVDHGVALSRALTEAAQSRLTRIVGTRDDIRNEDFEKLQSRAAVAASRSQMVAPTRPPRQFAATVFPQASSVEADIIAMCERLATEGLDEVVVADLSQPGVPVSVVRVIVPGLEGAADAPGYRPGQRALAAEVTE